MHSAKTAVGGIRAPIAVFAATVTTAALLLTGCGTPAASSPVGPPASAASGMTTPPPAGPVEPPETTKPVPEIPTVSAALEDRPALRGQPPVRLEAPDLGIDVPIQPVALDGEGRMGLPADPSVAAWYSYGVAPGDASGSAVVAAHVDSLEYDIGPFARLADAPSGTVFEVTSADGTVRSFALESTELVLKGTVDWSRVFRRDGAPVLTLVTCGGEFDWDARRYLSTVIVTALATG